MFHEKFNYSLPYLNLCLKWVTKNSFPLLLESFTCHLPRPLPLRPNALSGVERSFILRLIEKYDAVISYRIKAPSLREMTTIIFLSWAHFRRKRKHLMLRSEKRRF